MFADFHANRYAFSMNLGRAGVSSHVAKKLAKHSDIDLTMNVYTYVELGQQAGAVNHLPTVPQAVLIEQSTENKGIGIEEKFLALSSVVFCPAVANNGKSQVYCKKESRMP